MIHIFIRSLEDTLQLPETGYVSTDIIFVSLMLQITLPYFMSTTIQFFDKGSP